MTVKSVLTACVRRMKAKGVKGKLRDDAVADYCAGAAAAVPGLFAEEAPLTYAEVIEVLSEVAVEEETETHAEADED